MFVESTEGCAGERPLGGDAEVSETSGTDRVRRLVQELGSLSGVGAGGGKVATVQFGRSEIDQNQHTLPAPGRARVIDHRGEHLACVGVIAGPYEDATSDGRQLRGTVMVKRRRGRTTTGLIEEILRAVERVVRCGAVVSLGVDGGLNGGEPRCDGRNGSGVLACDGEVVERGDS